MDKGSISSQASGSEAKLVPNVSYDFFDLANAAGKFSRNPQSKTALDHFFDKLKYLEKEWYEFSNKYEQIVKRNEHLMAEFEREKNKAKVYQKRLKFVKENQENVDRLRELHESIKCLEQKPFSNKEVQTEEPGTVPVDKETISSAKDTLNIIKDMVSKRESRYSNNMKKMELLQERVNTLEAQNKELTQFLTDKCNEADECRKINEVNDEENTKQQQLLLKPESEVNIDKSKFKSRLKVRQIPIDDKCNVDCVDSDIDIPLKAIKSMKSSLTTTLSRVRSGLYSTPQTSKEEMCLKSKNLEKGDGKEVEVLKKIRSEIAKKQLSIKSKIDAYNNLMND